MNKRTQSLSEFALVLAYNYRDSNARLVCINQINQKLYNNWRQLIVQLRVSADKCKHVDFNKRTRGAVFVPSDQVEQVRAFQDSINQIYQFLGPIKGQILYADWNICAQVVYIYNKASNGLSFENDTCFRRNIEKFFSEQINVRYQQLPKLAERLVSKAQNVTVPSIHTFLPEDDFLPPQSSLLVVQINVGTRLVARVLIVADENEQNSLKGIYWAGRSISKHILKSLLFGQSTFTYKGCTCSAEVMFAFPMWETYQTHMSYFCNTKYPKTIYIYKQKNISLLDSADFEAVTAWMWCIKSNDLVPMTVLYSPKQEKYYLNASTYEDYCERYGLPFFKIECINQDAFSDFNLRTESELKMYGYSVSKADGLTSAQRQSRLAQLMDSGLIPKSKIISHLDLLIKMNYGKEKMEDACYAWKDDRRFVLDYKLHNQRSIWATAFETDS